MVSSIDLSCFALDLSLTVCPSLINIQDTACRKLDFIGRG